MKVRHKQHPDVMVDLDASTRAHWLAGLSKDAWELAPEDRWQDVTVECEVITLPNPPHGNCENYLRHKDERCEGNARYRLRKVQLLAPLEPVTYLQWAFIIEQKVD